jgi:hypothetical protein
MLRSLFTRLFERRTSSLRSHRTPAQTSFRPALEPLEDRSLLATFRVLNLNDAGAGSLRQALLEANANPGADVIQFRVAGTIRLTSGALPVVVDTVKIDGTTARGFGDSGGGSRCRRLNGLQFDAGSAGPPCSRWDRQRGGRGITLNASGIGSSATISAWLDGRTAAGNRSNG